MPPRLWNSCMSHGAESAAPSGAKAETGENDREAFRYGGA